MTKRGWNGIFDQQSLFKHLYHDNYQYILKPDTKPGQFEWLLGLTTLTVGMGDRSLISPTDPVGLLPNNINIHGFTGFETNYDHRLTYIFIVDDPTKSGTTYVIGISFSPLTPKLSKGELVKTRNAGFWGKVEAVFYHVLRYLGNN